MARLILFVAFLGIISAIMLIISYVNKSNERKLKLKEKELDLEIWREKNKLKDEKIKD